MFIKTSVSNGTANKCAAANRRPARQSDGSGEFRRDSRSRRSLPAPVAELGRQGITLPAYMKITLSLLIVAFNAALVLGAETPKREFTFRVSGTGKVFYTPDRF